MTTRLDDDDDDTDDGEQAYYEISKSRDVHDGNANDWDPTGHMGSPWEWE